MKGFLVALGVAALVWIAGGVVLCAVGYHVLRERPPVPTSVISGDTAQ